MSNDKQSKRFLIFVLIILPGLSSLIFIASLIWNLPSAKLAMGICALINFYIGLFFDIASRWKKVFGVVYDGQLIINTDQDNQKIFRLSLDRTLEELEEQTTITFVINRDKELIDEEL